MNKSISDRVILIHSRSEVDQDFCFPAFDRSHGKVLLPNAYIVSLCELGLYISIVFYAASFISERNFFLKMPNQNEIIF